MMQAANMVLDRHTAARIWDGDLAATENTLCNWISLIQGHEIVVLAFIVGYSIGTIVFISESHQSTLKK